MHWSSCLILLGFILVPGATRAEGNQPLAQISSAKKPPVQDATIARLGEPMPVPEPGDGGQQPKNPPGQKPKSAVPPTGNPKPGEPIPPTLQPPTPPNTNPQDFSQPPSTDAFSQAPSAGTAGSFHPINMFGDQFGGGTTMGQAVIRIAQSPQPGALNGTSGSLLFEGAQPPGGPNYVWTGGPLITNAFAKVNGSGTYPLSFPSVTGFTQNGPGKVASPSASALAFIDQISQPGQPLFNLFEQLEKDAGGSDTQLVGFRVTDGSVTQVVIGPNGDFGTPLEYDAQFETVVQQVREELVQFNAPNAGTAVGRIRITEDISPLPQDRFIFNYDYFNNTQLSANGWDVNRFVFGFEKTFLDRRASVEVRLPFASTLQNDLFVGQEATGTEFGDIRALLKFLLYSDRTLNIASGLAITMPTGSDYRLYFRNQTVMPVMLSGGQMATVIEQTDTELLRIRNETVILTPYIGMLFTPASRWFAQGWVACEFDTRGNQVLFNPTLRSLQPIGRFTSPTILQLDGQLGYWLVSPQESQGFLRGLAPFVELHYNSTISDPDIVADPVGQVVIGDPSGNRDELNMSAGFSMLLGNRVTFSVGAVAPLVRESDRSFDYQIGCRANVFFGPSVNPQSVAGFGP